MPNTALPILNGTRFRARFETELRAAARLSTLQINIGYVCNLACNHCHIESSPARTAPGDNMDEATARKVVEWALGQEIETVDFTGGSPEMNPSFRWMVETLHGHGLHIMDRCNPTIIEYTDPRTGEGYGWIPEFLARHEVEVVASMPCYLEDNVERQRGRGSYNASIRGLLELNAAGYGRVPALRLNLVYNPVGQTSRRRRPHWRRTTAGSSRPAPGSSSTSCGRSPTCRSSGGGTGSIARASSSRT